MPMMRFDKFTSKAQEALQQAQEKAYKMGQQSIEPVHLLFALAVQPEGVVGPTLQKIGIPPDRVAMDAERALNDLPRVSGTAEQYMSPALNRLLQMSFEEAEQFKDEYVSTEHLLLAISRLRGDPAEEILRRNRVTHDEILKALASVRGTQRVGTPPGRSEQSRSKPRSKEGERRSAAWPRRERRAA